jgi:hypothetical protein
VEVHDPAREAPLIEQLERSEDIDRDGRLAAPDDDGAEEQMELVDQAGGHGDAGELRASDADIAG